jgi:hypothetical protein
MQLEKLGADGLEYPWLDGCFRRVIINCCRLLHDTICHHSDQSLRLIAEKRVQLTRQQLVAADRNSLLEHFQETVVAPKFPFSVLSEDEALTLGTELEHVWRAKLEEIITAKQSELTKKAAALYQHQASLSGDKGGVSAIKAELKEEYVSKPSARRELPRFFRGSLTSRLGSVDGYFVPRPAALHSLSVELQTIVEERGWDELASSKGRRVAQLRSRVLFPSKRKRDEGDDCNDDQLGLVKREDYSDEEHCNNEGDSDGEGKSITDDRGSDDDQLPRAPLPHRGASCCSSSVVSIIGSLSDPSSANDTKQNGFIQPDIRKSHHAVESETAADSVVTVTSIEVGASLFGPSSASSDASYASSSTSWLAHLPSAAAIAVVRNCLPSMSMKEQTVMEALLNHSAQALQAQRQPLGVVEFQSRKSKTSSQPDLETIPILTDKQTSPQKKCEAVAPKAGESFEDRLEELVRLSPYCAELEETALAPYLWPKDEQLRHYGHNSLHFSHRVQGANSAAKRRGRHGDIPQLRSEGRSGVLMVGGRGEFPASRVIMK